MAHFKYYRFVSTHKLNILDLLLELKNTLILPIKSSRGGRKNYNLVFILFPAIYVWTFLAALVYFAGNVVFVVLGSTKEQPWNHNPSNPGERNQAEYEPISTSDIESD